jgi:hypothetical protein
MLGFLGVIKRVFESFLAHVRELKAFYSFVSGWDWYVMNYLI